MRASDAGLNRGLCWRMDDQDGLRFGKDGRNPAFHTYRLKLASFNIQTGLSTSGYHEYVTGGWRHMLPSSRRLPNLARIAQTLGPFDIVGLQEVDGGSIRSHQIVQTQYLAQHANFPYWHNQVNRRFGRLALHSNGLLSRFRPIAVHDHKLPGLPGRGAIVARFRVGQVDVTVCCAHLALSKRARLGQVEFLADLLGDTPFLILMGDLNCEPDSDEYRRLAGSTRLRSPVGNLETFPSWRPRKMLDHILVGQDFDITRARIIDCRCSDHLPIAMDVQFPTSH